MGDELMSVKAIIQNFRQKVCDQVRLEAEGVDRYHVFTPFLFEDGDHLVVILKQENGKWILSDEGHTFMHLTYDLEDKDLRSGGRQKIISNALAAFSVEDRNGELILSIDDDQYGDALYRYIQALLRISDVSYLSRDRVRTTFMEDVREFVKEQITGGTCPVRVARPNPWSWRPVYRRLHDRKSIRPDPHLCPAKQWPGKRGNHQPSYVREVGPEIPVHRHLWRPREINRKTLAKFSDVCEKQFSNFPGNKDRFLKYVQESGGVAAG